MSNLLDEMTVEQLTELTRLVTDAVRRKGKEHDFFFGLTPGEVAVVGGHWTARGSEDPSYVYRVVAGKLDYRCDGLPGWRSARPYFFDGYDDFSAGSNGAVVAKLLFLAFDAESKA